MNLKRLAPCILISIIALSCQKKDSLQEIEIALDKFSEVWERNGNNGNRIANADLFTDDGILVRSGKVYSGKESIQEFLSQQNTQINFIKQELKTENSWYSEGYYMSVAIRTITFVDVTSGDTITSSVPAVNIWERQTDGSLKLACSMKDSAGK